MATTARESVSADAATGAKKIDAVPPAGLNPTRSEDSPTRTFEYAVRLQRDLWEVWQGDRMLVSRPTYIEALRIAEILAHVAVGRGDRAKILVGEIDGRPIEFPVIELRAHPT